MSAITCPICGTGFNVDFVEDMDLMLRAIAARWTVERVGDEWLWRGSHAGIYFFVPRSPSSLRPEITDEIRELMEKTISIDVSGQCAKDK